MSENKKKLLTYLKSRDLVIVATSGEVPTACVVYYGIDEDFTIYIVTYPSSEHGKNIKANQQVACVITDTNQSMYDTKYKSGVQIKGTAKELTETSEMKKALQIWSRNNDEVVKKFVENISKKTWEDRVFVIKPTEIKWFNEELYGKEGVEIFKL